uniref:receptor protein-tyrosine kinase n=2 Tax=Clastoptera arizonana TaxID=38151 RepID=A0A1B6C8X6_9HEMI
MIFLRQVYLQLLNKLKWSKIGALSADGHKYTEYLAHLQVLLRKNNITFDFNNKFPPQENIENIKQYLQDMMEDNIHIIIGDVYDNIARIVMCIAFEMGMTSQNSYVWFLPSWLNSDWYDTDKYNKKNNETVWCNTEQMVQAINGYFSLSHAPYGPNDSLTNENITVKQWKEKLKNYSFYNRRNSLSEYAGYAYDAVWMYAYALKKLYDENPTYLLELHSENTTKRMVEVLKQTNFQGVSGTIQFRNQASRISVVNVIQCYFKNISDKQMTTVAVFHPNNLINDQEPLAGLLSLNESLIHWFSPGGIRPTDGILPPPKCLVESFKNLVGVKDCEVALVIANFLGFGFIGVVLSFIFIQIYKVKKKELEQIKNLPLLEGRLDRWEIPRNKLVINRKLGEGAFGDVYGGEAYFDEKGWIPVAVKALKVGSKSEEKLDFLSEAEVMKKFDHKNIIKLLAVCIRGEPTYTIMELMLYGDLKTFLLARRHLVNDIQSQYCREANEVSSKKLTMMALDVALALSYLAERKIVHRDVACRNVLVNAQRIVKLGDFGMTRLLGQKDYYKFNRKGMLPVRWMAPESLGLGIFTTSSDIWSYGVLLFEIITFGSFPFQGMSNYQVLEHVKAGNTLKIPSGVKPQMGKLIEYCWNANYKLRPEASEIVEFLTNNPQLVTPCLDVPISSVQTEEDGISNMLLSETLKKCPLPSFRSKLKQSKYTQWNVQRHYNLSSSNNISMVKMSSSPESKNDNKPKTDFGEPLLKKENKYFTLDHSKKKKDSEEIMDFDNKNSSEESLL